MLKYALAIFYPKNLTVTAMSRSNLSKHSGMMYNVGKMRPRSTMR